MSQIVSLNLSSGGRQILVSGFLFLTLPFSGYLDAAHHWYSALAGIAALALAIERRSTARMAWAGTLWVSHRLQSINGASCSRGNDCQGVPRRLPRGPRADRVDPPRMSEPHRECGAWRLARSQGVRASSAAAPSAMMWIVAAREYKLQFDRRQESARPSPRENKRAETGDTLWPPRAPPSRFQLTRIGRIGSLRRSRSAEQRLGSRS